MTRVRSFTVVHWPYSSAESITPNCSSTLRETDNTCRLSPPRSSMKCSSSPKLPSFTSSASAYSLRTVRRIRSSCPAAASGAPSGFSSSIRGAPLRDNSRQVSRSWAIISRRAIRFTLMPLTSGSSSGVTSTRVSRFTAGSFRFRWATRPRSASMASPSP